MRLSRLLVLLFSVSLGACNSFATEKKGEYPEIGPSHELEDIEFQKLRDKQDSLLERRQKKSHQKVLDTLKPKQA